MDDVTNLSTERMPNADELAEMVAGIKSIVDTRAAIVRAVGSAASCVGDFVLAADRVDRRQFPNAVPPVASTWRRREEQRRYGRVLTYGERRARWRAMWGGLA